jgi:hypothetical protein
MRSRLAVFNDPSSSPNLITPADVVPMGSPSVLTSSCSMCGNQSSLWWWHRAVLVTIVEKRAFETRQELTESFQSCQFHSTSFCHCRFCHFDQQQLISDCSSTSVRLPRTRQSPRHQQLPKFYKPEITCRRWSCLDCRCHHQPPGSQSDPPSEAARAQFRLLQCWPRKIRDLDL